jgi:murein DD-endopeptidase MepM/ murein hydrolase activator NlpD
MIKSKIKSNFYVDARSLGIPASVVDSIIKTLSEKIDFRRSLNKGDKFEILYSKKNEMLYTKITTKKREFSVYRFTNGKSSAYYFANGEKSCSVAHNNFFGLPLNGKLSVSDRYGWRRHPFTGQYHHHTGVDLRAAYGSSVLAIYDGVVTRASYYCGYGHCVDIKHASGYSSRYAHLSKYAVRVGNQVKKGQVIGKVGSSGISTGAHLHLELAKNNAVLNPFSVKMLPTEKASVTDKYKFNILKKKISNTFSII